VDALRADDHNAQQRDPGADQLHRLWLLAEPGPGEKDRDEDLQLDQQRDEADRHAKADRREEQPELANADEEAVKHRQPKGRLGRLDEENCGKSGEAEAQSR
jgi:hypothetical protein